MKRTKVQLIKLVPVLANESLLGNDVLPYLDPTTPEIGDVIASLHNLSKLPDYFCNLLVKKRHPAATHIPIIMNSEEKQNRKPYSLPVQYVPYHTICDQCIRDLRKKGEIEGD